MQRDDGAAVRDRYQGCTDTVQVSPGCAAACDRLGVADGDLVDGRADRGFFPAPFLGAAFFAVRAICCFLWMKDFKPGEVQVRAYSASVGKRW